MSEPVFGNEKTGSIRDIPLPGAQEKHALDLQGKKKGGDNLKGWNSMKKKNKRQGPKIAAAVVILLGLFFIISSFFHKAELTVTPKQESAPVVQTYKATNTGDEGTVSFARVAPFEAEESLFIEGSVEENVQTSATGKITVKNDTDSQQRFIPRTRFETPDGLVYRTPRSVVIPANGETEITVTADIPGDEYNSESGLSFTLPGLQGTAGFNSFTAVQTGEITGGFSGIITTATKDEIEAGKKALETQLENSLRDQLVRKVPAGFVATNELMELSPISFSEKPNQERGGIEIIARGTVEAVMFEKQEFDNFVASSVLKDYTPDQSVSIENPESLTIRILSDDFDLQEDDEFEFSLKGSGETTFKWKIDTDAVAAAVAGKDDSYINQGLISELAGSTNVDLKISPFWKSKVPQKVTKIQISVSE